MVILGFARCKLSARYIVRPFISSATCEILADKMKCLPQAIAVSTLALIVLSGQASGQKTYALGIGGGAAIPVGKLSNTETTGYNGIVALALGVADLPIGVRFDGIYNSFSRKTITSPPTTTYGFRIAGLLGNLIYAFPGTTAKSYIVAGGGLYNTKFDVAGTKAENHWGLNAGLGMTFAIGPMASFLESRYHFISREPTKGGVIHFVPITLGVMF
jgi:Outer membrane protein beta-barrel domain